MQEGESFLVTKQLPKKRSISQNLLAFEQGALVIYLQGPEQQLNADGSDTAVKFSLILRSIRRPTKLSIKDSKT